MSTRGIQPGAAGRQWRVRIPRTAPLRLLPQRQVHFLRAESHDRLCGGQKLSREGGLRLRPEEL